MKRRILMVLLALGALAGFAAGIASLRCHRYESWHGRRAGFEKHVAEICADAALRARPSDAPR